MQVNQQPLWKATQTSLCIALVTQWVSLVPSFLLNKDFDLKLSLTLDAQDETFGILFFSILYFTAKLPPTSMITVNALYLHKHYPLSSQNKQQCRDSVYPWFILVILDMTSIKQEFCGILILCNYCNKSKRLSTQTPAVSNPLNSFPQTYAIEHALCKISHLIIQVCTTTHTFKNAYLSRESNKTLNSLTFKSVSFSCIAFSKQICKHFEAQRTQRWFS